MRKILFDFPRFNEPKSLGWRAIDSTNLSGFQDIWDHTTIH